MDSPNCLRIAIFAILIALSSQKACLKIMPGMVNFLNGIDITTFDPLSSHKQTTPAGFKLPIFRIDCLEEIQRSFGSEPYFLVNGTLVTDHVGSESTKNTFEHQYFENHKQSIGSHFGIEAGNVWGAFSASQSYMAEKENFFRQDETRFEHSVTETLYRFQHDGSFPLSEQFVEGLNKLPKSYWDDPDAYNSVIDNFGLYFLQSAILGGELKQTTRISGESRYYANITDLQKEAQLRFSAFLNSGGKIETKEIISERPTIKVTEKINVIGGQIKGNSFSLDSWKSSLQTRFVILGGELRPIYLLIKDKDLRQQMKLATMIRRLQTYVNDIKKTIDLSQLPTNDANFLRSQIQNEHFENSSLPNFSYQAAKIKAMFQYVENYVDRSRLLSYKKKLAEQIENGELHCKYHLAVKTCSLNPNWNSIISLYKLTVRVIYEINLQINLHLNRPFEQIFAKILNETTDAQINPTAPKPTTPQPANKSASKQNIEPSSESNIQEPTDTIKTNELMETAINLIRNLASPVDLCNKRSDCMDCMKQAVNCWRSKNQHGKYPCTNNSWKAIPFIVDLPKLPNECIVAQLHPKKKSEKSAIANFIASGLDLYLDYNLGSYLLRKAGLYEKLGFKSVQHSLNND